MDHDAQTHLAISRLQGRYADIVTRMAWTEMADIVSPSATFSFDLRSGPPIELVGLEALVAFGTRACEQFTFYLYQPLNTVLTEADEVRATGRSYALEVGEDRTSGAWVEFYGLYHDEYRLSAGGWRFERRRFQTLARRVNGATTTWPDDAG